MFEISEAICEVFSSSAAEKNIQPGDLIKGVNRNLITDLDDVKKAMAIANKKVGVRFLVKSRNGIQRFVFIKVDSKD